jgi:hypothetical protein
MEKTNSNNGRPKLELLLNRSMQVKLLKDKPFEGSSTYGPYFLYTVEHEGVEKAYFATPEVHAEITKLGLGSGAELLLTKIAHQNARRISPAIEVEAIQKPVPTLLKKDEPRQDAAPMDGLKTIMEISLKEAVEITRSVQGVPFQNEDIQKIASCLFIARTRPNA